MSDGPRTTPNSSLCAAREFTTTREELFQNLVLNVPHGYVETQGEYGPGRTYYLTVGDLLDAFWAYCDAKEAE